MVSPAEQSVLDALRTKKRMTIRTLSEITGIESLRLGISLQMLLAGGFVRIPAEGYYAAYPPHVPVVFGSIVRAGRPVTARQIREDTGIDVIHVRGAIQSLRHDRRIVYHSICRDGRSRSKRWRLVG